MTMDRNEQARGFPAFPTSGAGRGQFARAWWGRAWIEAMRETALDPEPLKKGRRYARSGHVGTITVSPGRISASVHDGDEETSYRTIVRIQPLTDQEWGRFLDQVAAQSGHIAALLDGSMPRELVRAAEDVGVRLLPGMGDLEPECDCPGWDHPCQHAAALCFQTSWLLDADPFVLLLLRGRGRRELLDQLRYRDARPDAAVPSEQTGTPAFDAYVRKPGLLPDIPSLPATSLPPLVGVPQTQGVDLEELRLLAAGASARARDLLEAADFAW